MQDRWYGDHGDLVKWCALIHLARRESIFDILQVAMYRSSKYPALETREGTVGLPCSVVNHFRSIQHIQRLNGAPEIKIQIFSNKFRQASRSQYFEEVSQTVSEYRDPVIVLVDPDIGVEPQRATVRHVKCEELRRVFGHMKTGDILAVYQHGNRKRNWREDVGQRLADALSTETKWIETLCSDLATRVVILAVKKQ